MIKFFYFFAISFIAVLLCSCAARFLSALAIEDAALIRGAGIRSAATGLAVTDEALVLSRLSRVRVTPRVGKPPLLYTVENGSKRNFAELINENSLKSTLSGRAYNNLPFRFYKVRNNLVAELREGPGIKYKVFKAVPKDRLVLVLEEHNGWYKVMFDNIEGWIIASALISSNSTHGIDSVVKEKPLYKKVVCDFCKNKGNYGCFICHDKGEENCTACNGKGFSNCSTCKGNKNISCKKCKGHGDLTCSICNGKKSEGCLGCDGKGRVTCIDCSGAKASICFACKGDGGFSCAICKSTGILVCDACDGVRILKCYYCFGRGYYFKRIN